MQILQNKETKPGLQQGAHTLCRLGQSESQEVPDEAFSAALHLWCWILHATYTPAVLT